MINLQKRNGRNFSFKKKRKHKKQFKRKTEKRGELKTKFGN